MKNTIKTGIIAFLAIAVLGISSCGVEASTSGGTAAYAVTYNANGGSGVLTDPGSPYESGAAVTVLANAFTRSNYIFTSWNTAADGSGTPYHAGATFTINADTTLYAQWSAEGTVSTVTYNSNGSTGGAVPVDSTVYINGATVTVKGNTGNLVKTDHSFTGWNTAADGSGTAYQGGQTFTINANTTLYAQWVADVQGIEMVQIPAGTFKMGSPDGSGGDNGSTAEPNRSTNETLHNVTLTYSFKMSKYEVTQKKYRDVMGALPALLYLDTYGRGDNYPVYYVSWYDALVFCNKLSITEGLTPAYSIDGKTNPAEWGAVPTSSNATWNAATCDWSVNGYRLPTEAEWEYACRAGTTTAFNWGTNQIADTQANFDASGTLYNGSPQGIYREKTTEVGTFAANAWGLHDMHGNVWEWCWDWYGPSYYTDPSAGLDPRGAVSGDYRVRRGGSWVYGGQILRSAFRDNGLPYNRIVHFGFRLVRP